MRKLWAVARPPHEEFFQSHLMDKTVVKGPLRKSKSMSGKIMSARYRVSNKPTWTRLRQSQAEAHPGADYQDADSNKGICSLTLFIEHHSTLCIIRKKSRVTGSEAPYPPIPVHYCSDYSRSIT
jgi:hypothetical protein